MKAARILLLTAALVFPAARVAAAAGVECGRRPGVADSLERAAAVFSGEAVAEEYRRVDLSAAGGVGEARVLVVRFKVARWWKGGGGEEVVLYTSVTKSPDGSTSSLAEDFHFRKGESYLVYAYGPPERLRTSACTRTGILARAGEDLRELGEGRAPEKRRG